MTTEMDENINHVDDIITLNEVVNPLVEEYQKNHYTKYLKDKRVVIVGPDTSLQGKGLGSYIDSFDVVIRHNTVFEYLPFTGKLKKDYGSRTDVIYLSPQCIKDYSFKSKNLLKFKENNIKFLVYMNGNKDRNYLTGEYCFSTNLEYFKKYLPTKLKIPMHYAHHSSQALTNLMTNRSRQMADGLPVVPRVGFISIFDTLVHQAKSVEILGMSFYHGGGHAFRKEVDKPLDPLKNAIGRDSAHDSFIELELLKEILKEYPQIKWEEHPELLKI